MNQQNKKPNKLDLYKEKMNEREQIEKNFAYNPFGKGGNGAPIRDNNGNIITSRKIIDLNRENIQGNNNNNNFIINREEPQLQFPKDNHINNNNYSNKMQSHDQDHDQDYSVHKAIYKKENSFRNDFNNNELFKTANGGMIPNYPDSLGLGLNSNTNIVNNTKLFPNIITHGQGNKINISNNQSYITNQPNQLPQQNQNESKKILGYQNDLLKQIEEKKLQKENMKRRELELDRLEEDKYHQYINKKKEQEEQIKLKKSNFIL